MKQYNFLCNADGKPIRCLAPSALQLDVFNSNNNNIIKTVQLPDWLNTDEYIKDSKDWNNVWSNFRNDIIPEHWQRSLMLFAGTWKIQTIAWLFNNVTSKSDRFMLSLYAQLLRWLDTDYAIRQYPNSPFSKRQWSTLYDIVKQNRLA